MIGHYSHDEPITVKALLIALGVLVITQVGVTIFYLVIFYGLAGDHWDATSVLFSLIYGFKYALITSGVAFVIAVAVFGFREAMRRRKQTKII
jgi:nitrogen regulatory protein PII-like uncharacterized protein